MASTIKIPDWKIEAMLQMYDDGESRDVIAAKLGVSTRSVRRYCGDTEQKRVVGISNRQRNQLLTEWRPA